MIPSSAFVSLLRLFRLLLRVGNEDARSPLAMVFDLAAFVSLLRLFRLPLRVGDEDARSPRTMPRGLVFRFLELLFGLG